MNSGVSHCCLRCYNWEVFEGAGAKRLVCTFRRIDSCLRRASRVSLFISVQHVRQSQCQCQWPNSSPELPNPRRPLLLVGPPLRTEPSSRTTSRRGSLQEETIAKLKQENTMLQEMMKRKELTLAQLLRDSQTRSTMSSWRERVSCVVSPNLWNCCPCRAGSSAFTKSSLLTSLPSVHIFLGRCSLPVHAC